MTEFLQPAGIRDIIILRSKASVALTEMEASVVEVGGNIPLKQLDQFLGEASKLHDVMGLDRRDNETLSRTQKASNFAAAMKHLRHMCINATTDEAKQRVSDKVSKLRNQNLQELRACYP